MKSAWISILLVLTSATAAAAPVCEPYLQRLDVSIVDEAFAVDAKTMQELIAVSDVTFAQRQKYAPLEGTAVNIPADQFKSLEELQNRSGLLVDSIYGESVRLQDYADSWIADFENCPEFSQVNRQKYDDWKKEFEVIQLDSRINESQLASFVDSMAQDFNLKTAYYRSLEGQMVTFAAGEFFFLEKWFSDSRIVTDFYRDLSGLQKERMATHSERLRQILSE